MFVTLEFKVAVEESVLHGGLPSSGTLEAGIEDATRWADYAAVREQSDRLIAIGDTNDFEVNVMIVEGDLSRIVASNDQLNVEPTDKEEHEALLESLESDRPVVAIDAESGDIDPDDHVSKRFDPNHPAYYFQPGVRFVAVTTSLFDGGRGIGRINRKYALRFLDDTRRQLPAVRQTRYWGCDFDRFPNARSRVTRCSEF